MGQPVRPRLAISTTCHPSYKPIQTWHVCISGFLQSPARPSGLEQLWVLLRNRHNNGKVNCELRQWNARWHDLAEQIHRLRPDDGDVRVYVYAYSWGAGWGFVRLAKALRRCGIEVRAAVLTDPVFRSSILPAWLPINPLSLLSAPAVRVPCNVREVHWFFQRTQRPYGHHVIAEDPSATKVHEGVECDCDHLHMDDLPDFRDRSLLVAENAAREALCA